MIAHVEGAVSSGAAGARLALIASCAVTTFLASTPARAEIGAAVSVFSDDRYHGLTLSDGRPIASLDLSYDSSTGLYGALSGTAVASREGPRPLRITANAGFARPIGRDLTADVGIVHWRSSHYSGLASGHSYTELYAGVAHKEVTARLSLSPSYGDTSHWMVRGAIGTRKGLSEKLSLDAELAASLSVDGGYERPVWDARVGLTRRIGSFSLQAAVTARGPSMIRYYAGREHHRAALVIGIGKAL